MYSQATLKCLYLVQIQYCTNAKSLFARIAQILAAHVDRHSAQTRRIYAHIFSDKLSENSFRYRVTLNFEWAPNGHTIRCIQFKLFTMLDWNYFDRCEIGLRISLSQYFTELSIFEMMAVLPVLLEKVIWAIQYLIIVYQKNKARIRTQREKFV